MSSLAVTPLLFLFIVCLFSSALGLNVTLPSGSTTNSQPITVRKVCDVCNCTDNKIDCSNRRLDNNLDEYEWPEKLMKVVTFANNEIKHIKKFPNIAVNKLILSKNKIEKIDNKAFELLNNFTELDLSYNMLTYDNFLPHALQGQFALDAYEPLDQLKMLNLSGNKFRSLNCDIFEHVENIKILILSNNPFYEFDNSSILAISDIPYLEELDLSHCKLKKLDEVAFQSLRYLKKLNLGWNKFTNLPDALRESKSVENLIFDGNPIQYLSDKNVFPVMPSLNKLSMCNMSKLLLINKGALSNLEALETLTIENCTVLSEIDDDAFAKHSNQGGATWPPLKTLNISNNALHYLPATLLARWDKLKELHLLNNNWNCDCDNQYFIGMLLPSHGKRLMGNETFSLRCSSPPEHLNRSLVSLADRKLRCQDAYGARPERDAAILVGMLAGVLLAVPIVVVFFFLWRRGFLFCGPQGPASFSRAFYKRTPPYADVET